MKMTTMNEIRQLVRDVILEAKKKKEKAEKLAYEPHPKEFTYDDALDFSAPLGAYNLYRSQGASNWGPMTGAGSKIDDRVSGTKDDKDNADEALLRSFINNVVKECLETDSSWGSLRESSEMSKNIWEAALHWYDHQKLGLGHQTTEGIEQKKLKAAKQAKQNKK